MQNDENKRKFNQNKYISDYKKSHYKETKLLLSENDKNMIIDYCKSYNLSQNKYILACVKYCIDNAIDIDELLSHLK